MSFFEKHKLTTTQMIAGGFFIAILTGGLILMLPFASKSGEFTPFVDALFMSTTAICVTGLTTVVTTDHWSFLGQFIILSLIQFGGLGVVTFITSILMIFGKRITLSNRLLIQEAYNLDTLKGLVKLTRRIMKGTFVVEGVGALFYSIQFIPEYGVIQGSWYSIFHAVSSFCNAGIDLIGPTSFLKYQTNPIINITTMLLIIFGGIGYPVWWDFINKTRSGIKDKHRVGKIFRQMELHSKLAITVTAILILTGAGFVLLNEYSNPGTIGNLSLGNKIMASFFQSITFRTAGYSTLPQENLTISSALLGIVMMFIGGSPSGTAGGIKTVTIAVLLLAAVSSMKGKADTEIFGRKIPDAYVKKALAVFFFSLITLLVSTSFLSLVVKRDLVDLLYESASALGTVGLSRNLTSSLPTSGKYIIIFTMYLGRIGPIALALALNISKNKNPKVHLPDSKIIVG